MEFLNKIRPAVKKPWLIILAGLMWSAVGVFLCSLAVGWWIPEEIRSAFFLAFFGCILALTIYRLGFSNSRPQARQLVRHGHFLINGKKVDIPSYQVKTGDVVEIREKSRAMQVITDSLEAVVRRSMPQWLELEKEKFKGMIKGLPVREDITMPIQENQIVELYSR